MLRKLFISEDKKDSTEAEQLFFLFFLYDFVLVSFLFMWLLAPLFGAIEAKMMLVMTCLKDSSVKFF